MAYITQAEALWDVIESTSLMSSADAGTTPNKGGVQRNPIVKGCDVDGAVYWKRSADSYLNAISTGLFAQTGALLYEITKKQKYLDGTKKAMGWLSRMMMNTKTGILNIDSITPGTCGKNFGSLTYNTGVFIGANLVLARVTGDSAWIKAATLSATTASTTEYSGADLLMTEEKGLTKVGDATNWRGKFPSFCSKIQSV